MKIEVGQSGRMAGGDPDQTPMVAFGASRGALGRTGLLAVLADDVDGLPAEQEAARMVLERMSTDLAAGPESIDVPRALMQALEGANEMVCEIARGHSQRAAIGVSVVAVSLDGDRLFWIAVGDSRLYCLRRGELVELTRDQTVARHLRQRVLRGELTLDDLERDPQREALTSFLGMDPIPDIDITLRPFPLTAGDRLLLCSHGLYSALSPEDIALVLRFDAQSAADELVERAVARVSGDHDGIHAAVIALPAPRRPSAPAAGVTAAEAVAGGPARVDTPNTPTAFLQRWLGRRDVLIASVLGLVALATVVVALLLFIGGPAPAPDGGQTRPPDGAGVGAGAGAPAAPSRLPLQYRDLKPVRH